MSSRRVKLSSLRALNLYEDGFTESRRNSQVRQLTCLGKACELYTPEAIRCESLGGSGTDVDWKCTADLPDSLRFGRVDVSCEGWDGPGDEYVLKGSCALQYRLVQIPGGLRTSDSRYEARSPPKWLKSLDIPGAIFTTIWVAFLVIILYSFLKSCLPGAQRATGQAPPRPRPDNRGGPGGWSSDHRPGSEPPPPYSKSSDSSQSESWRPGFWTGAGTGAALAGLGNHLMNRQTPRQPYDWEREREQTTRYGGSRASASSDNRGEGSSSLGAMRSSSGLGGSTVR